jgi:hypothetical protein
MIDFKKLLAFTFVLLSASSLFAQSNLTLYQSQLVPQANTINPGFIPKTNFNIGLPVVSGISVSFANAFSFDDLEAGLTEFPNRLAPVNYFTFENSIDLLHVGFKVNQSYISLSIQEKISAEFSYPQNLFKFILLGNGGEFLGKRLSLDGFGVNFNHYREYALSYAKPITRKLTIGIRAKYLYGMENINTASSELGITTVDDPNKNYPIVMDGKAVIHTSGVNELFDNQSDGFSKKFSTSEGIINYSTALKNNGYGADIGFNYDLNKRIAISGAVNDIGSITWRDGVKTLKNENINFSFEGVDMQEFFSNGNFDSATAELVDSLNAAFELKESSESYTTALTPKVYGGVRFKLSNSQAIGLTTFFQFIPGAIRPAFSVSYEMNARKWLGFTTSYTIMSRSYANVGIGLVARVRAIQLYFLTDNALIGIFPEAAKNTSFRFGLNLIFGRKESITFAKMRL